jgi:hypothetical protein
VTASFAVSGDTAVVEMAEAAGLRRLPGGRPAPLTANTFGVGFVTVTPTSTSFWTTAAGSSIPLSTELLYPPRGGAPILRM